MPAEDNRAASQKLREIVAHVLEIDLVDVHADARFYDDLSANSLEKVEITLRIEKEFGALLSTNEVAGIDCVADALALLQDKGVVG